ncbi:hypothetical protein O3G_MSEX010549 [Manduca sexta]|uniref:Peroxidase n=1 Tax=Manduca sexta TaxID=7130 RepID=A0A921ZI44_MANSE|nr:hypothetical protein O3G_MSEX010549 [Manduca sexta]
MTSYFNFRNCTTDVVLPCDENEPRRLDGTCNNPNYPSAGGYLTPLLRSLSPIFGKNQEPRDSASGEPLPLERKVRKRMLFEGKASDPEYTQLLTYTAAFTFADTGSVHDTMNFLTETTHCCTAEGKNHPMCAPIEIPNDDDTLRYSGIRCLNLTRPKTFQTSKCAAANTEQSRIESNTASYDLSFVYGSNIPIPDYRMNERGMIKYEEEDGSMWPSSEGPHNVTSCMANVVENGEKRCFGVVQGSILPVTLAIVWFYRLHNIIAAELAEINPHWSDDKLFYTARDICIAINNQMNYYEVMPELMGKDLIEKYKLHAKHGGFRDIYDPKKKPQASFDFIYGMRWFHIAQEGTVKLYDEENNYLSSDRATNMSLRVGFFSKDNKFSQITRGAVLQPAGGRDRAVDPDISGLGLGGMQHSTDLTTADLRKGRLFGLQPYVNYLEYCGSKKPTSWKELAQHLGWEYVEQLREIYNDINDVDLLVGLWGEKGGKQGFVPPTLGCLLGEQMYNEIVTDRHWYERPNRPYAFTEAQLKEIRKANYAAFLCTVEPKIKTMTRHPLRRVSALNPLVSCSDIGKWDLRAWQEFEQDC